MNMLVPDIFSHPHSSHSHHLPGAAVTTTSVPTAVNFTATTSANPNGVLANAISTSSPSVPQLLAAPQVASSSATLQLQLIDLIKDNLERFATNNVLTVDFSQVRTIADLFSSETLNSMVGRTDEGASKLVNQFALSVLRALTSIAKNPHNPEALAKEAMNSTVAILQFLSADEKAFADAVDHLPFSNSPYFSMADDATTEQGLLRSRLIRQSLTGSLELLAKKNPIMVAQALVGNRSRFSQSEISDLNQNKSVLIIALQRDPSGVVNEITMQLGALKASGWSSNNNEAAAIKRAGFLQALKSIILESGVSAPQLITNIDQAIAGITESAKPANVFSGLLSKVTNVLGLQVPSATTPVQASVVTPALPQQLANTALVVPTAAA